MITLTDKNILITGASSGLGEATAILAASLGAKCFLIGTNPERLEKVQKQCVNSEYIQFDLTDNDYKELVNKLKMFGSFDYVVHSAGKQITKPFIMFKEDDYNSIFDINVKATFKLIHTLIKNRLLKSPSLTILLSSIVAREGGSARAIYAASKGAVESLAISLNEEYKNKEYKFTYLAPGLIDTPMTRIFVNDLKEINPEVKTGDIMTSTEFAENILSRIIENAI